MGLTEGALEGDKVGSGVGFLVGGFVGRSVGAIDGAGVFIVGTPIAIVMLYQSMSLIFTQFTHANIKMPRGLDKALSYVIVSPDMHKVHHHHLLPYTDSNYGNIFSIWDRLLGTYKYLDREKIVYGVDTFPNEKTNSNLWELLKQPFQKYRKPTNLDEVQS